jgi:hypothetical protein
MARSTSYSHGSELDSYLLALWHNMHFAFSYSLQKSDNVHHIQYGCSPAGTTDDCMESVTCSQLCATSYIGLILRWLNEFSNKLAIKQNDLTRHITAVMKVNETKVSITSRGEVLQKVMQLQIKKFHNNVLWHPVACHLFSFSYPLCHMQTCVNILKFTTFLILKLFSTSLIHYTFQPVRLIGDVKNYF